MRNKIIFSALFLLLSFSLHAQKTIKEQVIPLIQSNQLKKAEKVLDSILTIDPKAVDAWMLKGNLQYFKYNNTVNMLAVTPNYDESIYNASIGEISSYKEVIPASVADSCIYYFQKAISLDEKRSDIYAGICYVLSISFQTDKLIQYLPVLISHSNMTARNISDYAYNMIDRDSLRAGLRVFDSICAMFPEDGNIVSDMAAVYYTHGDIENAKAKVVTSLTKKRADELTWGNAFFLYGVTEEYKKAAYAIKVQSDLRESNDFLLYEGLSEMYVKDPQWKEKLNTFTGNTDKPGKLESFALFLMNDSLKDVPATYDTIRAKGLHDGYNMIVYHHLYNLYPNSFYAALNYAEALTHSFRYADAEKVYAKIKTVPADSSAAEAFHFYYAWTLYKTGNPDKANVHWQPLTGSHNFYYKSAACYFLAKYYRDKGDKKNAKKYCEMVSKQASESKYAGFCDDMLARLF